MDTVSLSSVHANGEMIRTYGSRGSALGQLNEPYDVAVDGDGNILVVDMLETTIAFKS